MPSNRLALVSVAVGSALLGWATAGVAAIGSDLPARTPQQQQHQQQQPLDRPEHGHHHHNWPGV